MRPRPARRPSSPCALAGHALVEAGFGRIAAACIVGRMKESSAPARPLFRSGATLADLNAMSKNTAMEPLGIEFTELGPDYLRGTMPVDARTHQPYGLLHGGASVLLAETLGSSAGGLCAPEGKGVVGIEINANHLRGVRDGRVTGTARPLHVGGSTQVWEIRIEDEAGRLVCISRLTLAVVTRPA